MVVAPLAQQQREQAHHAARHALGELEHETEAAGAEGVERHLGGEVGADGAREREREKNL